MSREDRQVASRRKLRREEWRLTQAILQESVVDALLFAQLIFRATAGCVFRSLERL